MQFNRRQPTASYDRVYASERKSKTSPKLLGRCETVVSNGCQNSVEILVLEATHCEQGLFKFAFALFWLDMRSLLLLER